MIVTGILIAAAGIVAAIANMMFFIARDNDSDNSFKGTFLVHGLCAAVYITGLVLVAIGIYQELTSS
jgi:hypothetical protein